jgi:hypothetical protein
MTVMLPGGTFQNRKQNVYGVEVGKGDQDGSWEFRTANLKRAVATPWCIRQGWANVMQWPNRKYIDCEIQDRGGKMLSSVRMENIFA